MEHDCYSYVYENPARCDAWHITNLYCRKTLATSNLSSQISTEPYIQSTEMIIRIFELVGIVYTSNIFGQICCPFLYQFPLKCIVTKRLRKAGIRISTLR